MIAPSLGLVPRGGPLSALLPACSSGHVPEAVRPVLTRTELEHVRRPPRRDSRSLLFGDLGRAGGPGDRTEWQVIPVHLPPARPGRRGGARVWPPPAGNPAVLQPGRNRSALGEPPARFPP